ncbi:hypothetical protein AAFC00_000503 [Neodothiora populina]|uniref:Allergen n=1 Tax=Neodothiora populina TaxID=2781224 RepID=A0ABR3PD41_9PEZI
MDAAKNAVKDFMSKSGHHDTTVHEKVAPGVTHETINRQNHENVQTAIDKEIHQDHYHTSVQPVVDREVLPEQHHHKLGAVEHRQFEHGNDREVAERLKAEAAQFHDKTIQGTERHTQSVAPTLAGEHIHHHVHETIQPVVQKETIEPHVTHTTVPIHEVHHNAAQHHSASALPAVSLADFKKQGGVLTGREERYDGFEGEPRSVGGHSTTRDTLAGAAVGSTTKDHHLTGAATGAATGHHHGSHSSTTGTSGGYTDTTGTGVPGSRGTTTSGLTGSSSTTSGTSGTTGTTTTKPSLLDKLNPMKDSDHDGKKGMMD